MQARGGGRLGYNGRCSERGGVGWTENKQLIRVPELAAVFPGRISSAATICHNRAAAAAAATSTNSLAAGMFSVYTWEETDTLTRYRFYLDISDNDQP